MIWLNYHYVISVSHLNNPAKTRHWADVLLMLCHRLRRWPNIKRTSTHCLVFAGNVSVYTFGSVANGENKRVFYIPMRANGNIRAFYILMRAPTISQRDPAFYINYRVAGMDLEVMAWFPVGVDNLFRSDARVQVTQPWISQPRSPSNRDYPSKHPSPNAGSMLGKYLPHWTNIDSVFWRFIHWHNDKQHCHPGFSAVWKTG